MSIVRDARMLAATATPVSLLIDSLFAAQDNRNSSVFEMAAQLRDPEPELGDPVRNQCTGGME
ncbi:hypothetical protein [Sphingomonas soli]|uniref:hypothetical protein n=1 Tax=Sphingomonas soli TaxID=266127 RepID=UPI000829E4D8|nr:hypothetical protein [Sphingomonas soli]